MDAVYYYMRNLMSSNPMDSAWENLKTLFDEIRKKVSAEFRYEFKKVLSSLRLAPNKRCYNLLLTCLPMCSIRCW